jgi:hypothetical protein
VVYYYIACGKDDIEAEKMCGSCAWLYTKRNNQNTACCFTLEMWWPTIFDALASISSSRSMKKE